MSLRALNLPDTAWTRAWASMWRAALDCLNPKVAVLSILPLVLAGGALYLAGLWGWEAAIDAVRSVMERYELSAWALRGLDFLGLNSLRAMLAPMLVVFMTVPVVVILALLLVSVCMTPAIVSMVAKRRFADLQKLRGANIWQSLAFSLLCTGGALLAFIVTLPLCVIPPLILVLPPLIWGWLTYRVFTFDALADHASKAERERLMLSHRGPLLALGVVCGYLGAAPALLWATGALTFIFAPLLVVASVWLYTLVFAFSSLWFTHYSLGELQRMRAIASPLVGAGSSPVSIQAIK